MLLIHKEPFTFHPRTTERLIELSHAVLWDRIGTTSGSVEYRIKPYKYEVEVNDGDWERGHIQVIDLFEKESKMCESKLLDDGKKVGGV